MKLVFVDLILESKTRPILPREELLKMDFVSLKRYAHGVAQRALNGRSKNEKCCVCGYKTPKWSMYSYVHAHHEDYMMPMRVSFLCKSHHRQRHAALKLGKPETEPKPRNEDMMVKIWGSNAVKILRIIDKTHRTFASEVNVGIEEYSDKKLAQYRDDGR